MKAAVAQPGSQGGHVPDALAYGPVRSRRFGCSLGLSFSLQGQIACSWHCPYCQLGGGRRAAIAEAQAPVEQILAALDQALAEHQQEVDVVTIAGAGEPLEHPQAVALLHACKARVTAAGLDLVLLSNGSGLQDPALRAAVSLMDATYIKWDPGAPAGAWCRLDERERQERITALRSLRPLRIQSLVFRYHDQLESGNNTRQAREEWCMQMHYLQPSCIHLTTAGRESPSPAMGPVSAEQLKIWAQELTALLPQTEIAIFA